MVLTDDKHTERRKLSRVTKVVLGGFCGMVATTFVHPLDLIKVRMQVHPMAHSTIQMAQRILRCEGFPALYTGLTAGLLRQATSTTTRLGVYYFMYEEYKQTYGTVPSISDKVLIGAYAGLIGAFAGNPSEVVLVRMMADGKRDPCTNICGFQKRYRGVFDAVYKIIGTEGLCALWRGGMLTLTRSLFVSIAQIGTYTQANDYLKDHVAHGTVLHIYTSIISSFFTAILTLPVDLVKTRYQFRSAGTYMTQPEVFEDILRNKGVLYFWKGFLPYYIRLSIHTMLTYLLLEEFHEYYFKKYHNIPKK